MKVCFVIFGVASLLVSCAPPSGSSTAGLELVMPNGSSIEATTKAGTILISAGEGLERSYTWEGATRTTVLEPREKRWKGSLGGYTADTDWKIHDGITRLVGGEGQQHFQTASEAMAWIKKRHAFDPGGVVYRDDGLLVYFGKSPQREQLNVDVFQIYIGGNKPQRLQGSKNSAVTLSGKTLPMLHRKDPPPTPAVRSPDQDRYWDRRSRKAVRKIERAKGDENRFYELCDAAGGAFYLNMDTEARSYALELEKLAPQFKGDWKYGNAVHDSNITLGRLALKEGRVAEAKSRLLAAGRTPGSPQLDNFGPDMTLAQELLKKGERGVVLRYFQLCRAFWKSGGEDRLDQWTKEVNKGYVPDFGSNLNF